MTDTTPRRPLISRESVVPLGIATAVVCIAAASAWNVATALVTNTEQTNSRFRHIEQKLDYIEGQLSLAANNHWRRDDMKGWVELLQARNAALHVPDVR